MSGLSISSGAGAERTLAYGLGSRRAGVLMKLYVLHESGELVGVFSSPEKLADHIALNPTVVGFVVNSDGVETVDRVAAYRTQVVNLNEPRTDA